MTFKRFLKDFAHELCDFEDQLALLKPCSSFFFHFQFFVHVTRSGKRQPFEFRRAPIRNSVSHSTIIFFSSKASWVRWAVHGTWLPFLGSNKQGASTDNNWSFWVAASQSWKWKKAWKMGFQLFVWAQSNSLKFVAWHYDVFYPLYRWLSAEKT